MLDSIAKKNKLSLGLFFPIEAYKGSVPTMQNQVELAQKAEAIGFKSLWFRDVPFHDPRFGDAGQLYDPWVYMTHIMNHTTTIQLATGSIILPLRYPVHTAKAAFSLQNLSNGRLILGTASGDRPIEYPAFNKDINSRSELFRENFKYIRALEKSFPTINHPNHGDVNGTIDLLPKPISKIPMLVTGHSGQSLEWIAKHSDGWIYYPRNLYMLEHNIQDWTISLENNAQPWKPFFQSLYIDLLANSDAKARPIHLGFQSGSKYLVDHLKILEKYGVNHVIINLKYSTRDANYILDDLAEYVLPHFREK